jgi:hypothetical protein
MTQMIWYEVWTDEGVTPPYVLLLIAADSGSRFDVYDPAEKRATFTASTYDEAKIWLLEDEYTKVEGRMTLG